MTKKNNIAIEVKNVSKSFILPHEKRGSVKSFIVNPFKKIEKEKQDALKNVSFTVNKGDFFGVVGRNGSGKSTLLKCMAGVYTPSKGHIKVNGTLVPFIELGVGFNPDLSGRDNVYLNGALLGFTRKEIDDMYDEIVEFSELEKFMDQKLKNYSSGMQVRLAFSIAIKAEGDILLLDEVLAVGDSNFRQKCADYFGQIKRSNKTVILVTHDMDSVEKYCNKAVLIDSGELISLGKPREITDLYNRVNMDSSKSKLGEKAQTNSLTDKYPVQANVEIRVNGKESTLINAENKNLDLLFSINPEEDINKPVVGVIVKNGSGTVVFATNTNASDFPIKILRKNVTTRILLTIDNIFSNGKHEVSFTVKNSETNKLYYRSDGEDKYISGGRRHTYAVVSPSHKFTNISLKKE